MGLPTAVHLKSSLDQGWKRLESFRLARKSILEYIAGPMYGPKFGDNRTYRPLNLLYQQVTSILPALIAANPKVVVRPKAVMLADWAAFYQQIINNLIDETNAGWSLVRACALEAMVSPLAIAYTGLRNRDRLYTLTGFDDPGEPYTTPIEFDDWCVDPNARNLRERTWEAHKIRPTRAQLLASPYHNREVIARLKATGDTPSRTDDADQLSRDRINEHEPLSERVALWHVVMYDGDRVFECEIPADEAVGGGYVMEPQEWVGPGDSPYEHLAFTPIPSNAMPISPMMASYDMAHTADTLMEKLIDQVKRSKRLLGYRKAAKDDVKQVVKGEDGETVPMEDPRDSQVFDLNMVSPELAQLLPMFASGFQTVAGNPNLVGGQGRVADTAAEAEILASRAGIRTEDMRGCVIGFFERICRRWLWYLHNNDKLSGEVVINQRAGNPGTPVFMTAAERMGVAEDFGLELDVRTMSGVDHNLKAARLNEAMQVIMAAVPFAQAGVIDLRGLTNVLRRELGTESLEEILADPAGQQAQAMVQQMAAAQPSQAGQIAQASESNVGLRQAARPMTV